MYNRILRSVTCLSNGCAQPLEQQPLLSLLLLPVWLPALPKPVIFYLGRCLFVVYIASYGVFDE